MTTEGNGPTPDRNRGVITHILGELSLINGRLATSNDPAERAAVTRERDRLQTVLDLLKGETAPTSERSECPECGSTSCPAPDDSLMPTHDDLEGAVNLAVDAGEACEHFGTCALSCEPESTYEVACYERVRELVFTMAELVPAGMSIADAKKTDWKNLGPAAVMLDNHLVVAWPVEQCSDNEHMPRSAEIRSLLFIPINNVVPRC